MSRPKVDRSQILTQALAIIDREGLESLSMRKLGLECGVEAMTLYNHVADKTEVLDGVVDGLYAAVTIPDQTLDWTDDLINLGLAWRNVLVAHPRALALVATRPAVGAGGFQFAESVLATLARGGITALPAVYALSSFVAFLVGHVLLDVGEPAGGPEAASTYQLLDGFPHLASVGSFYQKRDPRSEFRFGLEALIRGMEAGGGTLLELPRDQR